MTLPPPDSTLAVRRGVPFRDTDERTLHLDWYRAESASDTDADTDDPRPAVVLVHGGAWHEGTTGQLSRYALDFAAAGFVAVDVTYRLSGEATFPAAATDVAGALAWVRDNADALGVDAERVAVFGHSAGAHLALLTALAPGRWSDRSVDAPAAVVGASGPYEFRGFDESEDIRAFLGDSESEVPERYADASPLTHAHGDAPPTLLVHGDEDDVVPLESSQYMKEALDSVGAPAKLAVTEGGDHVFLHASAHYPAVFETVRSYLDEQV